MNALHLVCLNLGSAYPGRRLALSTVVVFIVVAVACRSVNALDCPANPHDSCSWGGAAVPCSNTTFCYTDSAGLLCDTGQVVNRFKNTNPPAGWTTCKGKTGAGSCNENPQQCGTQTWFWGGLCDAAHQCAAQIVHEWCKGPAANPNC
jgi:hypothetical protein